MIRVVSFEPQHIDIPDLLEIYEGDANVRGRVLHIAGKDNSVCHTLLCPDGSVLGVVGLSLITDGYAQMWSLLSKKVRQFPLGFHKALRFLIEHYWKQCNLYRIETRIEVGNHKAWRQNRFLGFSQEAILRKSSLTGKDEYIFSRVR